MLDQLVRPLAPRRRRLVRAPHFAKPSSTENLRTLAADPAELDASIEALAKVDEAVRIAASRGLSLRSYAIHLTMTWVVSFRF